MAHLSLFLLCQRHVIAVKYSIQLRDVVVRVHLSSGVVVKKMQLLLSPARKLLFQRESYGRFVVEEQRFLASALTVRRVFCGGSPWNTDERGRCACGTSRYARSVGSGVAYAVGDVNPVLLTYY